MWTATKLANRAARAMKLDNEAKTRLHRTFRNFVAKGVIETEPDQDDDRGTLLFNDNAAAVALLLVPMADLAIDARGLRDASNAILPLETLKGEPPIAIAVTAAKAGKHVSLITKLARNATTQKVWRSTFFEIEGEKLNPNTVEIIAAYKAVAGIEALATLTLPANALLKPLLDME